MDSDTTCETLPRPPISTGILLLKLKRKLQYKGHQYFESVRPQALKDALLYLKRNHIHYSDIEIQMQKSCLQSSSTNYPVYAHASLSDLSTSSSVGNDVFSIAPGENSHPVHFMNDKHCEEMAFPTLFPTGKYGFHVVRQVPLSPVKYFNARLLNYTGRFAMNPEYLFLAQFVESRKKCWIVYQQH